ncbi:DUF4340 domain-containing protein [Solimonas terrae]|uniref:DUF4340 domain-containing protein n=1 Tax=Solimonas terrae TaxID=1396819 RepID=A0A6M2BXF0_9GAMM|nr:DUF4340 domain-containing protein [Solimonas terrae]NGY06537.1 DUF4340 domain-containing protein [Solimonas terrae]
MKRAYLNLALLVIVAGLAATVWFTQKKEQKGAPLTTLSADAVNSISIAHPDQPTIELEKKGAEWQLVEPVQSPTDPFEVASLVNLATQETKRTLKVADVKLADLKLDPPQFTITLNDQKLDFGDTEPLEYHRYVRHGDTIALIDDPSATAVDADYSNLVAKELISPGAEIEKIDVPGLSVSRSDGKDWSATPASDAASGDAIAKFVEAWRAARSMWNAAMPDDGGKGQPITITTKGGAIHLVLVSEQPQLIIDRPDLKIRYSLSKADADTLLKLAPPKPAEDAGPDTASAPTHKTDDAKPAEK